MTMCSAEGIHKGRAISM